LHSTDSNTLPLHQRMSETCHPAPTNGPRLKQHDRSGRPLRIGVFDSGLGGLSVLRALRTHLPAAELLYVADSGHAPYGEREDTFVQTRSEHISDFLVEQGVDAIVVACNTATAAAIHRLRLRCGDLPVVGVEPGVKPAVALSKTKRVGVLATPGTLGSLKFRHLVERHGAGAHLVLQACPGLAAEIEVGELDSPVLRDMVGQFCAPLKAARIDTVVLGCTHYPFVEPLIRDALGAEVCILDTAEAVAIQTKRMTSADTASAQKLGTVHLWSSADPVHLQQVALAWLNIDAMATYLP
jgi:glutamate racemase